MTLSFVRRSALLFALAIISPLTLTSQQPTGTVSGRVTDAAIGRGLPDVQIIVTGTRIGAVTGANGEYTLVGVPIGARTLTVRRIGAKFFLLELRRPPRSGRSEPTSPPSIPR